MIKEIAFVRKANTQSHSGDRVLGYATVTITNDGRSIVREFSACSRNPTKQIESLRKGAMKEAKKLKVPFVDRLEVTI